MCVCALCEAVAVSVTYQLLRRINLCTFQVLLLLFFGCAADKLCGRSSETFTLQKGSDFRFILYELSISLRLSRIHDLHAIFFK